MRTKYSVNTNHWDPMSRAEKPLQITTKKMAMDKKVASIWPGLTTTLVEAEALQFWVNSQNQ